MSSEEEQDIQYRKKALEHIAAPKKLDDLIKVISPKAWVVLSAFSLIVIASLLWFFLGTIVTRVEGNGILFAEKASFVSILAPEQGGYVVKINARLGAHVKENAVVAELTNPVVQNEIKNKERYIAQLKTNYAKLKQRSEQVLAEKRQEFAQKEKLLNILITTEQAKRKQLHKLLVAMRWGLEKGAISKERYIDKQLLYFSTGQNISQHKQAVISLKLQESSLIDTWKERLRALREKIENENYLLDNLRGKNKILEEVRSSASGRITAVNVKPGDFVKAGTVMFNITTEDQGLEAITYIKAEDGKRIRAGMKARVTPSTVKKLEFGDMKGIVTFVSHYPAATDSIMSVLKNSTLVQSFLKQGPVIVVHIRLLKDPTTYSGYQWTSSIGPQEKITPGTLITAKILVKRQSPFSLLIPKLKDLMRPNRDE